MPMPYALPHERLWPSEVSSGTGRAGPSPRVSPRAVLGAGEGASLPRTGVQSSVLPSPPGPIRVLPARATPACRERDASPELLRRFAHLAALWGFGVSQPVFSMLKGNPEFLVVRDSTRLEVAVFALLLAFGPPLAAVAFEGAASLVSKTLASRTPRRRDLVLRGSRLRAVHPPPRPGAGAALLLPLVPAMLVALAYLKSSIFRSILAASVVLPLVGCLLFVGNRPARGGRRAGRRRDGPRHSRRPRRPRRVPTSSLMAADGSTRRSPLLPAFARLGRRERGTPARRRCTRLQPRPRHPHRNAAAAVSFPTLADHPRTSSHFSASATRPRFGARHAALPGAVLPERREQAAVEDRFAASSSTSYRLSPSDPPCFAGRRATADRRTVGRVRRKAGAEARISCSAPSTEPTCEYRRRRQGQATARAAGAVRTLGHAAAATTTLFFLHLSCLWPLAVSSPSGHRYSRSRWSAVRGTAGTGAGTLRARWSRASTPPAPGRLTDRLAREARWIDSMEPASTTPP